MLYVADTERGACVIKAASKEQALRYMRREYGRSLWIKNISNDKEEVDFALAMGALIHDAKGE